MSDDKHERITRRGTDLFQLALRMEVGDVARGTGGAEALLYLASAIALAAQLSEEPRAAIDVVRRLFDKIDFAQVPSPGLSAPPARQLLVEAAFEMALAKQDPRAEVGVFAAQALAALTDAIARVAALNSNPRQIIEYVVQRLDSTDIEALRKELA